jgi:hypothetical protein
MTDDDRALLRFLAGTVMGWPEWDGTGDAAFGKGTTFWWEDAGVPYLLVYHSGNENGTPWNPLADLRDAGLLLDRMSGFELRRVPHEGMVHRCITWDDQRVGWATAETRERAVCLAAARAYGWGR